MEKIDRLGWAAGFAFDCHGVRIGIRANDVLALECASRHLPPGCLLSSSPVVSELYSLLVGGAKPGSNIRRYNILYWGSSQVVRTLVVEELFEKLEAYLHQIVAMESRRRLFLRAAVAGWDGKAIIILGPRSSG